MWPPILPGKHWDYRCPLMSLTLPRLRGFEEILTLAWDLLSKSLPSLSAMVLVSVLCASDGIGGLQQAREHSVAWLLPAARLPELNWQCNSGQKTWPQEISNRLETDPVYDVIR